MRECDLSNLVYRSNGSVNWTKSVGSKVKFVYDDMVGEFTIVKLEGTHRAIITGKHNENFSIKRNDIKECYLSRYLKLTTCEYYYKTNDIVNGLKIIKETSIKLKNGKVEKGYTVECIKDKCRYDVLESSLKKGTGCAVCYNRLIVKGVNDIATTHPQFVKYFKNINDAYKYSYCSSKKAEMICPICGTTKSMDIRNMTKHGFSCERCSDGISYPNKFIYNLLSDLGIQFVKEYKPEWAIIQIDGKDRMCSYDFYVPSLNIIIEADGMFHYRDNYMSDDSLELVSFIDKCKDDNARINGIDVIRIDCRESSLGYIKSSIMDGFLPNYIDLSNVNWGKIGILAEKSLVINVWNYCNNNEDVTLVDICNKFGISKNTVKRYLDRGSEINMCNYKVKRGVLNGKVKKQK